MSSEEWVEAKLVSIDERLERVERTLTLLGKHLGVEVAVEVLPDQEAIAPEHQARHIVIRTLGGGRTELER